LPPGGAGLQLISEGSQLNLSDFSVSNRGTMTVTEILADDLGQHVHLLRYLLDDDPPAAVGGYGFFAQLTAGELSASEPFLVMLNLGLDDERILAAAQAINLAAAPLCGDADFDSDVDSADLVEFLSGWTGSNGSGEGDRPTYAGGDCDLDGDLDSVDLLAFLEAWTGARAEFGNSRSGLLASPGPARGVPEPTMLLGGWAALACAAGFLAGRRQAQSARYPEG
jgi:hypothetical protein